MGFLEKLKFNFFDAGDMIKDIIKDWKPGNCMTEKDYEKSLYDFLHRRLDDIQITKQYAKGRIHADLVVGDKVIIELKNNLNTTSKYQRLIGQLTEYGDWRGQVILVLIGDTDPNLKKQLYKYIEKVSDDFFEKSIIVVEKFIKRKKK